MRHHKKNNWHEHCPKGKDSWCKFQQDAVKVTNTYIPGAGLPLSVVTYVKPIFLGIRIRRVFCIKLVNIPE